MGIYINKGNSDFAECKSGLYVDKSLLIEHINSTINTEQRFVCVTRSRRFGKSMAANMLCAYYDESCDSEKLFEDLAIADKATYRKYLNQFPVIYLDISDFLRLYDGTPSIVKEIEDALIREMLSTYPCVETDSKDDLLAVLLKVTALTGKKFYMIIDEWDAIIRECNKDSKTIDAYFLLLRRLFKGSNSKKVFAGVYATGILPIKKYKNESALNNFDEYSMVDPSVLAPYFGFTPKEISDLAERYSFNLDELKQWYDGYHIGDKLSIYNPYSVVKAILRKKCKNYWTNTTTYESVVRYIQMNFQGLKDDVIRMLAGDKVRVNTTKFQNDVSVVNSKDDIFTILIHLGYLAYDDGKGVCYIPNKEVAEEFSNAIQETGWDRIATVISQSETLLDNTIAGNEELVSEAIEMAHDENTSILAYNDENSLACVLSIAYIAAQKDYIIHRELPTGKGFADLVLIPRRNVDSPALVLELKYNKDADAAIDQIKRKNYPAKVLEYLDSSPRVGREGTLLLVGINYDKEGKKHTCKIERFAK